MNDPSRARHELSGTCDAVVDTIGKALSWFEGGDELDTQQRGQIRPLKDLRREAKRLQRAAGRPMCLAVFGPSQVGKSYLISSFARRGSEPLTVDLGGQEVDFLSDINPEGGGQEATGLVTRFSIRKSDAPDGFPVRVSLLSVTDIIKIIANSYFFDFEQAIDVVRAPEESELVALLDAARLQAVDVATPEGLSEDDVLDLREYFTEKLYGTTSADRFERSGYWDGLLELAGRLPAGAWVPLLDVLWGRVSLLTRFFLSVRDGLIELRHADTAFCELNAITPAQDSIININSLDRLGADDTGSVRVMTPGANVVQMSRSVLCAVTAELHLTLSHRPFAFFDHTDLLDFPGYRPRLADKQKLPDFETVITTPGTLKELVRRGKVDYLFDRYRREQEVTGLLLCVRPGNQDTHSLAPLVRQWVHNTHGASAAERARSRNALFVVKTLFDDRFTAAGNRSGGESERWRNAIAKEHLEFFSQSEEDWPAEWAPGQPFQQIFWIRNPFFMNANFATYSKDAAGEPTLPETGFANENEIERQKRTYLGEPLIQRHVADADVKWDEVLRLRDGGVSYLAAAIEPVCDPAVKGEQIRVRLETLLRRLILLLGEFHIDEDMSVEMDKRIEQANRVIDVVIEMAAENAFVELIKGFQIDSEDLRWAIADSSAGDAASSRSVSPAKDQIRRMLRPSSATARKSVVRDRELIAAEIAVERWSGAFGPVMGLSPETSADPVRGDAADTIGRELTSAARRVNLAQRIAVRLRTFTTDVEKPALFQDRQALIAADELNEFVWQFGMRSVEPADRPVVYGPDGETRPVFSVPACSVDDIDFAESEIAYLESFIGEWAASFFATVEENVRFQFDADDSFDAERNAAMGNILGATRDLLKRAP